MLATVTECSREVKAARGQFGECFEKERQAGRKGKVLCPINNPPNPPPPPPLACLPVVCVPWVARLVLARQAGGQAARPAWVGWTSLPARGQRDATARRDAGRKEGAFGAGPLPSNV